MQGTLPQAQKSGADTQHRVLLVDDDAVSLQVLSLMLGFEGHEVLQASDGESALAMLTHPDSTSAPDVLLVDMQMPGISGRELVQKIRAMEGPKPLLLGMSATALNTQQMRGFDGFLLKPLDLNDLRVALKPTGTGSNGHRKVSRNGFGPESPVRPGAALGKLRTAISEPHRKLSAKEAASEPARRTSTQAPTPRVRQAPKEQPINPAVLNNLRKAMSLESLKELYTVCLKDSRDRAVALQALAGEGKLAEIPRGAHQIKGAASMVGASRIARLATALELGSCKKEDTLLLLNDLLDACNQLEHILLAGKLDDSDN